jgi:UPF0755 protein
VKLLNALQLDRVITRKATIVRLAAAAVSIGLFIAAAYFGLLAWAERPGELDGSVRYEVQVGQPFAQVTAELHQQGVIQSPRLFSLYARLTALDVAVQAGEYDLPRRVSPVGLLTLFATGQVVLHSVQLPEGAKLSQVLKALRTNAFLVDDLGIGFVNGDLDTLLRRLRLSVPFAEGYFFPDTYLVVKGTKVSDVLIMAHEAMMTKLKTAWQQKSALVQLATPAELLILASIIEKESGRESDRRTISQVFHNRLQRNMRLQTDPTVIYALGDGYDGDIRSRDLRMDSPFNTYKVKGLPPTAIALPSLDSLLAAAQPSSGDYLYFVARGDGTSQFSRTLGEHNAAVRKFLLQGTKLN